MAEFVHGFQKPDHIDLVDPGCLWADLPRVFGVLMIMSMKEVPGAASLGNTTSFRHADKTSPILITPVQLIKITEASKGHPQ